MVGLGDRGRLETGLSADLVRVHIHEGTADRARRLAMRGSRGMTAPSTFRVAVYYAPELDDPLWAAGNRWLGRDPETGATLARPVGTDIPNLTDEPAAYGLHATLKPPMRLAPGTRYEDFSAAVADLAAGLHCLYAAPSGGRESRRLPRLAGTGAEPGPSGPGR